MASGDTRVTDVGGLVFGLVPMTILPFDVIAYFLHKCYDGLSYCTSPHYRLIYIHPDLFFWDVRVRNVLLPCSFPTIFGRAPATCGGGR